MNPAFFTEGVNRCWRLQSPTSREVKSILFWAFFRIRSVIPSDPMDIKNRRESNIRSLAVTSRGSITRLAVAIDVGTRKAGWVNRWPWKGARGWCRCGVHTTHVIFSSTLQRIISQCLPLMSKLRWRGSK